MFGKDELERRFGYKPTISTPDEIVHEHEVLSKRFIDLATILDTRMPECRAKYLMLDRLEETAMWAHKALSETYFVAPDPKTSRVLRIMGKEANVALLDFNELIKNESQGNVTQIRDYKNVKPTSEELAEVGHHMHELGSNLAAALRDRTHVIIKDRWHKSDAACFWYEDLSDGAYCFSHNQECDGEKCKSIFKDGKLEQ